MANMGELLLKSNYLCSNGSFYYNWNKGFAVGVLPYRYDKFTFIFRTIAKNSFFTNKHITIINFHKI
jgi:hypothetical protein